MVKLAKILVPVDFSDPSKKAIDYGAALALKFKARLYLAHVIPSLTALNYAFPADTYELEKRAFADARERLPLLLPEYASELTSEIIVKGGDVRDELLGIVRNDQIDLVVMGTHGRGTVGHILLGSTTESLLRRLPIPVFTVSHLNPEHIVHGDRQVAMRRILYASDLSENMRVGLRYSAELARAFNAELSLLNVMERLDFVGHINVPSRAMIRDNAISRFRWALEEEHAGDVRTEIFVVENMEGGVHGAITRFAENAKADLIVLNLHSKSFLERAMLGSTAERVIRSAAIPVLSLPFPADQYITVPVAAKTGS